MTNIENTNEFGGLFGKGIIVDFEINEREVEIDVNGKKEKQLKISARYAILSGRNKNGFYNRPKLYECFNQPIPDETPHFGSKAVFELQQSTFDGVTKNIISNIEILN